MLDVEQRRSGSLEELGAKLPRDVHTSSEKQLDACEVQVIVSDSDGSVRMLLDYFFSAILRRNVRIMNSCLKAVKILDPAAPPSMVVAGCHSTKKDCLKLIKPSASLSPKPLIIVLDHLGSSELDVAAFEAGADDVIRTPFSLVEFGLRLRNRLLAANKPCAYEINLYEDWDAQAHVATKAKLTAAESQVLRRLIQNDGQIVTRDELSQHVDGRAWEYGDRKFDVHIASIRRKLGSAFGDRISVSTVRSTGYRLVIRDDGSRHSTFQS